MVTVHDREEKTTGGNKSTSRGIIEGGEPLIISMQRVSWKYEECVRMDCEW